jgi:para-nitrobenzyl esterase
MSTSIARIKPAVPVLLLIALLALLNGHLYSDARAAETGYVPGLLQTTQYGQVRGTEADAGRSLVWKNIPYARAPAGELRWKAPQDPAPWTGVFDATLDGNIGIQFQGGQVVGSEDCLNLDIYRPNSKATNLPVLFYIHGGNNQAGTSAEFNAQRFAVEANAVVIPINYRLGLLGFNNLHALRTGNALEDSGNYTLLDFAQALDWVQENVRAFGGNPDNITIAGFSAGGRDVMALLISPLVAGKFHKAISFSGGMTLADYDTSAELVARAIATLVVEDKIKPAEQDAYEWLMSKAPEVSDYLYQLSADRLARLMINADIRMAVFPHLYNDGAVLPKEGFGTQHYNAVPLIMLTATQEFSTFARRDPAFVSYTDDTLLSDPKAGQRYRFAMEYGSQLYRLFNVQDSAVRLQTTYTAPIYAAVFAWGADTAVVGDEMARLYGAYHGVWMPFLTRELNGLASRFSSSFQTAGAQKLADAFTRYIANFLWTGDPNGAGLVTWNSWTASATEPDHLLLNADKDVAIITMTKEQTSYEAVLRSIETDTSVPADEKDVLIKQVLSGRWFSRELDLYFGNTGVWVGR